MERIVNELFPPDWYSPPHINFASMSGGTQVVCSFANWAGVLLDLVMFNFHDLCWVKVGCSFESSDQSHVSTMLAFLLILL